MKTAKNMINIIFFNPGRQTGFLTSKIKFLLRPGLLNNFKNNDNIEMNKYAVKFQNYNFSKPQNN